MGVLDTQRWKRTRVAVLRRAGYVCYWCGGRASEADHLRSRTEGGNSFDLGNIVAACKSCNSSRGGEVVRARERGVTLGARRRTETRERETVEGAIRLGGIAN